MYIPVPVQGAVSEWNRYINNLIKLSLTFSLLLLRTCVNQDTKAQNKRQNIMLPVMNEESQKAYDGRKRTFTSLRKQVSLSTHIVPVDSLFNEKCSIYYSLTNGLYLIYTLVYVAIINKQQPYFSLYYLFLPSPHLALALPLLSPHLPSPHLDLALALLSPHLPSPHLALPSPHLPSLGLSMVKVTKF
jgi:hypothetical protein